jgi:hypothetical protein
MLYSINYVIIYAWDIPLYKIICQSLWMPYVIKISSDGGNSYVDMFQHTGVKPKNTFNRTLIHRHLIADEHSFKPRCLYIKEFGKIKII